MVVFWYMVMTKQKHNTHTISDIKRIVAEYSGEILSDQPDDQKVRYIDKLHCKCKFNHKFIKGVDKLLIGRWCPTCRESISENIVRNFFEKLFGMRFEKIKPIDLVNKNGHRLELDGYNAQLKLAFEHNGQQHKKQLFNRTHDRLRSTIENDESKLDYCKKHGIVLIVVPDLFNELGMSNLDDFVRNKCLDSGIEIPNNPTNIQTESPNAYSYSKYSKLCEIAKNKGGTLLSLDYLGYYMKLDWECSSGHQWKASPANIKGKGRWCPMCRKKSLEESVIRKMHYDEKKTLTEIAKILGISVPKVSQFCKAKKIEVLLHQLHERNENGRYTS